MDDYDEFGNYIGEAIESPEPIAEIEAAQSDENDEQSVSAEEKELVLHENRVYYPSARQVYDADVQVLHYDQDTEEISQPLVEPENDRVFMDQVELPATKYDRRFQQELLKLKNHTRNIAIVGDLNHGKTSVLDVLVRQTHVVAELTGKLEGKPLKYVDNLTFEQGRGMTIKASPMSLLLQNSTGKSYNVNICDTPGHADFLDEVASAYRLAEGVVLVVDVVEGLGPVAKKLLARAYKEGKQLVMVLNKLDLLVVDLKLNPLDAYHRLLYVVDEVNDYCHNLGIPEFEPQDIVFESAAHRWAFTLPSIAGMYASQYELDEQLFARRLWGDIYYEKGKFVPRGSEPTFVKFALKPIYKLYWSLIAAADADLQLALEELGIELSPVQLQQNFGPLATTVFQALFGDWSCFVDVLWKTVDEPVGDQDEPVLAQVVKMVPTADFSTFQALVRVFDGSLEIGQSLDILGSKDPQESQVTGLWIPNTKYNVPVETVYAGQWALVSVSGGYRGATLGAGSTVLPAIEAFTSAVIELGIEPVKPLDLPPFNAGLANALQMFPALSLSSGTNSQGLLGPGEMILDCALYYLREVFSSVLVNVSDPTAVFCETCVDQSYAACPTATPNSKNKVTMLASPLGQDVVDAVADSDGADLRRVLKSFGWDSLQIRSIWKGPTTNVLINDTLGAMREQADKVKTAVAMGYEWALQEGPLCGAPLRNVELKLMDIGLSSNPKDYADIQIVSAVRKAVAAALLVASPRLMEPVYSVSVVGPLASGRAIYDHITRRRGQVQHDEPIPGTTLYRIDATVPVIDGFGLEADLRTATDGRVHIASIFSHWAVVPGDPLTPVSLKPLEAAAGDDLARDFVTKTRKRKGFSAEPALRDYLDSDVAELLGV